MYGPRWQCVQRSGRYKKGAARRVGGRGYTISRHGKVTQ